MFVRLIYVDERYQVAYCRLLITALPPKTTHYEHCQSQHIEIDAVHAATIVSLVKSFLPVPANIL